MLNLAEYRKRPALLADYLPWACLVAPGVILNKDGSFQRSARFRGPDLESATEAELVATCARINNVLRRFGSGWALFFPNPSPRASGSAASRRRRSSFSRILPCHFGIYPWLQQLKKIIGRLNFLVDRRKA